MTNLIDKLRSTQEVWEEVAINGFDPDLRNCGHAVILGRIRTDVLGIFEICVAVIGRIEASDKKLKSVDQSSNMAESVIAYHGIWQQPSVSFIESQQSYPDEDMPRSEMVAKSNDLLRLSHVAGAYHATASLRGHACRVVLPAEWKGNRPKASMHEEVIELIKKHKSGGVNNPFRLMGKISGYTILDVDDTFIHSPKNSHSLDALCLAYKGLVWVSRGEYSRKKTTNG